MLEGQKIVTWDQLKLRADSMYMSEYVFGILEICMTATSGLKYLDGEFCFKRGIKLYKMTTMDLGT